MARHREAPRRVVATCVLAVALILSGALTSAAAEGVGAVSGVVTAGGAPLSAAWVVLTPVTGTGDAAGDSRQVATDEAGRYSFDGLTIGHAKVHVRSPLVSSFVATFWPGAYTFGQAGVVPVTAGGFVANIDLPVGRSIEGMVLAEDTGEPVVGAQLIARIADAAWSEPAGIFEPGGAPGHFEISGLPPVSIRLYVQVPRSSPFLGDGYWPDGSESGRRVDSPGDVTGVVIRLPRGGELSGTVRDGVGSPVAEASVRVENCRYGCPRDATTDASGRYRIRGIAPGTGMIVHARAPGMIDQWYDRARDWIAAAPLALGAGEAIPGVDFVLISGGTLSGQVLAGDTGRPLTGLVVYLKSVRNPIRRYFAYSTYEDPNHYRIGPVPPDTYRLVLLPSVSQARYRPARWLAVSGIPSSGIIRFAAGQESAFVVTLARGQPDRLDCSGADRWPGLLRGFQDLEPWPSAHPCTAIRTTLRTTFRSSAERSE